MGLGNRIDMDTAPTTGAINQISVAGQAMRDGWNAASGQLNGLAGQLGKGPLGAAFLAGYQQQASETAGMVDRCCQVPAKFVAAGNQGVGEYGAANDRSRAGFDALK